MKKLFKKKINEILLFALFCWVYYYVGILAMIEAVPSWIKGEFSGWNGNFLDAIAGSFFFIFNTGLMIFWGYSIFFKNKFLKKR